MKLKASKREIKENSYRILSIGYCEAQYLLKGVEPFSYCRGVYGWSCDNYDIRTEKHQIIISTGYSPIESKNINKEILNKKYDIIKKYEDKARKINCNYKYSWQQVQKKINRLLCEFVDVICEEKEN